MKILLDKEYDPPTYKTLRLSINSEKKGGGLIALRRGNPGAIPNIIVPFGEYPKVFYNLYFNFETIQNEY